MIQKTGSSYPISHVGGMLQIRRSNAKVMRNAAPMVMTARLLRALRYFFPRDFGFRQRLFLLMRGWFMCWLAPLCFWCFLGFLCFW